MLNRCLNTESRCEIGMLVQRSYNQWAALRIHANLYLMTPGTEATCPGARPGGHLLVPPQPRPRRQPRTRPRPATPSRPLGLRPYINYNIYTTISTLQYLHSTQQVPAPARPLPPQPVSARRPVPLQCRGRGHLPQKKYFPKKYF